MNDGLAFPMPRARNREPAPARSAAAVLWRFVGGALVGASLAWFGASSTYLEALGAWFGAPGWNLTTLLALPLLWLLAVACHELGHLLGGRLSGMRALSFIVGPVQIDFREQGWQWLRNRSWSAAGGLALMMPTATTTRAALIAMVAGGPLASLLLAALALALVPVLPGWWGGLAGALAVVSALIGLATCIPLRAGLPSDGAQLLGLLRHDPNTRQRTLQIALLGAVSTGRRPRDWDPEVLAQLDAGTADPLTRSATLWLAALHALDRGDPARADRHWRSLAELANATDEQALAPSVRATWALALASWIADHHDDAVTARAWAAQAEGALTDAASRAMCEAAITVAEGGPPERARDAIARTRAALRGSPYRGLVPLIEDRLQALAATLAASESTPTAARASQSVPTIAGTPQTAPSHASS